ncbi:hypothetical protein F4775DRAFT_540575 [Biscogniauxia sp. FL1348]|nr:hypothetical protein F4775DRAFT_540575 [Biscogniauxia sp. FL1348]
MPRRPSSHPFPYYPQTPIMTSDVTTPTLPSLEPIWTNSYNPNSIPKTVLRAARSPLLAPSPISPRSLPSPMYPASYDSSVWKQERALVSRLDPRTRRSHQTSLTSPISLDERSPLVLKLEKISLLPEINLDMSNDLPRPPYPDASHEKEPSSVTISGPLALRTHSCSSSSDSLPSRRQRRDSAIHFSLYHELRNTGHMHFNNAKTADAFIIPRSLRRESNPFTETSPFRMPQGGDELPRLKMPNQITVRIVIRPRAHERKLFKFQHSFDMDELRASIPDPPPLPSGGNISGEEQDLVSNPVIHSTPMPRRRTSTVRSNSISSTSPRDLRSGHTTDYKSLLADPKTMPIHLKYASAFLPVLAGLLQLGDVRKGDVVYLPVPHAGAWPQTLRYVYTGRGELTPAVRTNIVYLAGKV